jgi:1-pyrroline-5-carboxylate dehydrogenase
MSLADSLTAFSNTPLLDFAVPEHRYGVDQALNQVLSRFGARYPLIIGGKKRYSSSTIRSINPSLRTQCVGVVQNANRAVADAALDAASRAFPMWSRVSQETRASVLLRMSGVLRKRRYEFIAWLILEVGKNWREADADVAEAIDFLEFYARQSLIESDSPTPVAGERNQNRYLPLGVVVVIPPWNFPLAILVGMTMAAVVTGNTVVLKPSSQSPVTAAKFMELVDEANVPPGVVNLLTGAGSVIGDYLVKDSRTRMVAFTGSKAVGLRINAVAAESRSARWIKRVIAEMGGKNAILVDASASVDAAAEAVVASAFGYQGQKCSACSRVYVHEKLYSPFLDQLVQRTEALALGPAREFHNTLGPVISAKAMNGIQRFISIGRKQGRLVTGGKAVSRDGFYLAPAIFERLPSLSPVWREEIFGPVLAVAKVKSFKDGLRQANSTDYGLTGAVFAQDPAILDQARAEMFCGNLYLNRKCTGALVGGHPFGGFNLSGTDSKAGGPDYLLLFRQAQSISERIRE